MEHFIFNKDGDNIISAGFGINSILMKKGLPPILTFDKSTTASYDDDESSSDDESTPVFKSFKHLAIPISLLSSPNTNVFFENQHTDTDDSHSQISDDIYDKLLKLVEFDNWKKRKSKKVKPSNKKTNSKSFKKGRTTK